MAERAHIHLAADENYIPTGLPGGFFIYDAEGDQEIFFAEQNVIELFGCKDIAEFRDFTHNSFLGMVHPDDVGKVSNDIEAQTLSTDKSHDYVRYRILTKQGETRYVEDFGHLLHGEGGRKFFYVYIVDVDADEYYNRNANSFAESQLINNLQDVDRLTGLMNMRAFYDEVGELLGDEQCHRKPLSFVHFDIVNFKVFNEERGFQAGDDLLCRLARILRTEFAGAKIARLSNDHFVVCAPQTVPEVIEHVARVHNDMASGFGARVEVKAGIYALSKDVDEVGVACNHARLACNSVKRRYDRMYSVFDPSLYETLRLQQHVVENVEVAVESGWMHVYYQPIVRIATGKICGYEALARWDDPALGFLPPSRFIGTLEEYHMIDKVDRFVVERVCADLAELRAAGEPLVPVSLNLSRLDFELCDIFELVESWRTRYDIPARLLEIEITESALNGDSQMLSREVTRFRASGYPIWVDDFGSGYSALNNLLNYDFDVLKLDLEFLRTYDEHVRAGELIGHVVQMALDLGVKPLQEGVEREEHLEFLRSIGCELAQGYYYARPMELAASRAFTRAKGLEWEDRSEA
jgi:diguanylate cyclase (GGDEF)-like protein